LKLKKGEYKKRKNCGKKQFSIFWQKQHLNWISLPTNFSDNASVMNPYAFDLIILIIKKCLLLTLFLMSNKMCCDFPTVNKYFTFSNNIFFLSYMQGIKWGPHLELTSCNTFTWIGRGNTPQDNLFMLTRHIEQHYCNYWVEMLFIVVWLFVVYLNKIT